MSDLSDVLFFTHDPRTTQVIERDNSYFVLRNGDYIMEATKSGVYGTRIEVEVYEYECYVTDNIQLMAAWKERFIEEEIKKATRLITKEEPGYE